MSRAVVGMVVAAAIFLGAVGTAEATPRFAVRTGAPCVLCHVNPAGGGMRTAFGRGVYARQRIPSETMTRFFGEDEGALDLDPRLGRSLAFGADLRAGYLYGAGPDGPAALDSFFLMQADLYVAAELGRHTTLYVDRGAYGGFEAFALVQVGLREGAGGGGADPDRALRGYLRVGHFVPAFGLRLEEHSTFTREGFGFGPTFRDSGVELGLYAGPMLLQASYMKGALTDGDVDGTGYARLEWQRGGAGPRVMAGASVSFDDKVAKVNPAILVPLDITDGAHQFQTGAHLGLSLGRFTYLTEVDYARAKSHTDGVRGQALVWWQQLSCLPAQGVELQATYETWDGDLDLRRGVTRRAGASVELYPWLGTELKVEARHTWAPSGPLDGFNEAFVLAHLFF